MSVERPTQNTEIASPETRGRIRRDSRDHVAVRTSLQVAPDRWDAGEVVKYTGRWAWAVVKNSPADSLEFSITGV